MRDPEDVCYVVDYKPDARRQITCSGRSNRLRQPACYAVRMLAKVSSRRMTSPTILFGVEAPAVRPTVRGPELFNQLRSVVSRPATVDGNPIGRCRISLAETRQCGSAI